MYVIKKVASRQPHPVPRYAHAPKGPFPNELFATAPVINLYEPEIEDNFEFSGEEDDEWYLCYHCDEPIHYTELNAHECE